MQKHNFLFFLLFLCLPVCNAKEYIVRYQTLTSGTLYHIETKEGEKAGKVVREKKHGALKYICYDAKNSLLATGSVEHCPLDTCVKLSDGAGKQIGKISALINNLYPTEYKVFQNERFVAKGLMNWLCSSFVLFDPENPRRQIVTYFRPFFRLFNDNWHFAVHEDKIIELSLLYVIGAFQTACDLNFEMLEPKESSL
jgi:hypothetical protein